ncbi:MAG: T9SS type A sorting domain-containing protein [Limnohabitans sp.]|nr:T9SS type A sorting domain-containing protein [Limnohabitans sp.]
MKKITLKQFWLLTILLIGFSAFSQSDYYGCITNSNGNSANGRAPHGRFRYIRTAYLITPTEMTASGLVNGDVLNSIVFNYFVAQNIATTGNLTVYLQNTTDTAYSLGTNWTTAITAMTTVSNSSVTIPNTTGDVTFNFSGGSPFTYTGGGLYVAFDFQNTAGTLPTSFVSVNCNISLANGLAGYQSTSANGTTLTLSGFRPLTTLGKAVTCSRPTSLGFANPTLTSADLSTVPTGTTVEIEYGPYNFTRGTGTTITGVTSTYTLSSLTNSTAYEYYSRTDCGGGNFSAWQGPKGFYTTFTPTNPDYNTGFEYEDLPFIGWLATPSGTANSWYLNFGGTGSPLVQEGEFSAVAVTPSAAAATEMMISRGINLTAGSTVTVTYYLRNYQASSSTNTASYQLAYGNSQTAVAQTNIITTETGIANTTFAQKTFNFNPASTGTYYFSFQNTSPANATGTHALVIDNFTVSEVLATKDFIADNFSIYPIPAKNTLNIKSKTTDEILKMEILDLNGRVIKKVEVTNEINISDIQSGVYMISIITEKGKGSLKFTKE